MAGINLPATVDRSAVQLLIDALKTAIEAGDEVVIDASGVERIGQSVLQLLLSAQKTAQTAGVAIRIADPSEVLTEAAALTGLSSHLFPLAAKA